MAQYKLRVAGMTCPACEAKVTKRLKALPGVGKVSADYVSGSVTLGFDDTGDIATIVSAITSLGYEVTDHQALGQATKAAWLSKPIMGQLAGLAALVIIVLVVSPAINFDIGALNSTAGYGTMFVVGLLTSVHCIGMCGGINMAQCINYKNATGSTSIVEPSLFYNISRVFSYTLVGALFGALGSAFNISLHFKGIVSLVAGLLMVIMGLNLLGLMAGLRRLVPKMPSVKLFSPQAQYGPIVVGLLNGFMPCGPLQAAQLYALSTGSAVSGAMSMFFFGLGTFPVMFTFGSLSTMLGSKFTSKLLKASGVFVILLGVIAFDRGLGLVNTKPALPSANQPQTEQGVKLPQGSKIASIKGEYQEVYVNVAPRGYEPIVVQKDIPVKMIFVVAPGNLNGCNNAIIIPNMNIQKPLVVGETVVEFTPTALGEVRYACWMNMIRSSITVVDDLSKIKVN